MRGFSRTIKLLSSARIDSNLARFLSLIELCKRSDNMTSDIFGVLLIRLGNNEKPLTNLKVKIDHIEFVFSMFMILSTILQVEF